MRGTSRARIINGVWTRNVPIGWKRSNGWRTAIHKNVLEDSRLRECRFVFEGGSSVLIPVDDLRRAVVDGPDYDNGRIWGPFNIDPHEKTVAGVSVRMTAEL